MMSYGYLYFNSIFNIIYNMNTDYYNHEECVYSYHHHSPHPPPCYI